MTIVFGVMVSYMLIALAFYVFHKRVGVKEAWAWAVFWPVCLLLLALLWKQAPR